ncbi:uncharacterized protein [Argopecten irradians]|uniref:uncharacterized protein n=1 Tax=Argopecten irradians TaxID=31199 RepID=UPI0037178D04
MKKQVLAFYLAAALLSIAFGSKEVNEKKKKQIAGLFELGALIGELFAGTAAETAIAAGVGSAASEAALGAGAVAAGVGTAAVVDSAIHHHSAVHTETPTPDVTICEDTGFCTLGKCDLGNSLYLGNVLCTGGKKCCIPSGTCGVTARIGKMPLKALGKCRLQLSSHACHDNEEVTTSLTCNSGYNCCIPKQ